MLRQELLKAKVVLEDGAEFPGYSFSVPENAQGEVVFNTGMVGYPQSLTDPSYRGQILTLTYPLVGNYGVPPHTRKDGLLAHFESEHIQVSGLVVASYCFEASHWNMRRTLQDWLNKERIPAITGVDSRALTQHLREKGAMLGRIVVEGNEKGLRKPIQDPNQRNIVDEVSCTEPVEYGRGKKRVAVVDTGVKNNIIRSLLARKLKVLRLPWDYNPFSEGDRISGILFANGPGDPKMVDETVQTCRDALDKGIPTFGICLGNQVMARAIGQQTFKLKYGHRSQNQPCQMVGTDTAIVTSQNHGFAVRARKLPKGWKEFFVNLNDGTNEGIRHEKKPFYSIQFHPEATPGPVDADFLFDKFMGALK